MSQGKWKITLKTEKTTIDVNRNHKTIKLYKLNHVAPPGSNLAQVSTRNVVNRWMAHRESFPRKGVCE